ncbi:MAG: S9 family peptidase [Gemmatimonadota bacterium]
MNGGRTLTWFALLCVLLVTPLPAQQTPSPTKSLDVDQLLSLRIISDLQLSSDGKLAAFTVTTPSLAENRNRTRVWLLDLATGEAWEATAGPGNERAPRFHPDGKRLAFISTRSGTPQIWSMPARAGETVKLSAVPGGVSDFRWSGDGRLIFLAADVKWPAQQEIDQRNGAHPTDAKIWTNLFYRHWNEWRVGVRQHVFRLAPPDTLAVDVTPFDRDVPPLALGGVDIATSPLGTDVAVVFNPDSNVAVSTNNDIFTMTPDGEGLQPITTANKGNDHSPTYSPDSRYIAYLSMETPGFEADRQQVMLFERATGITRSLTADWNLSVDRIVWTPDAKALIAEVEERGERVVYRIDVATRRRTRLLGGGMITDVWITPGGNELIFLRQTATSPPEVWRAGIDGRNARQVSNLNGPALDKLALQPLERFAFIGATRDSVFGWLMKPPGFDPAKKYPLVYLIHGGPQSAWLDHWNQRWNYAMFAARGYVVAAVNFHGSTGYGQSFTNSISGHWGDYPYEDLMKGVDYLSTLPFIDRNRMGAAGASFGGYMIYWLAGHTNIFRTLVAHSGIYNTVSFAGSTEELWFPHHEFGGSPLEPTARDTYAKWSPANFADQWNTPMLIIHGQQDFRVDVSEGYQAFSNLRMRNLPGKFLYFPDEGHWVLKPRNRRLWWNTVLDWLDQYLK